MIRNTILRKSLTNLAASFRPTLLAYGDAFSKDAQKWLTTILSKWHTNPHNVYTFTTIFKRVCVLLPLSLPSSLFLSPTHKHTHTHLESVQVLLQLHLRAAVVARHSPGSPATLRAWLFVLPRKFPSTILKWSARYGPCVCERSSRSASSRHHHRLGWFYVLSLV